MALKPQTRCIFGAYHYEERSDEAIHVVSVTGLLHRYATRNLMYR